MTPGLRVVVIALALVLLGPLVAGAEPCPPASRPCDDPAVPGIAPGPLTEPPSLPPLAAPAPSLLGALARLFGAVLVLAILIVACLMGYRRLMQRTGLRSGGVLGWATRWGDDDGVTAIRVGSRRHLGGRESVAMLHVGDERFLIGITAAEISLLARLEPAAPEAPPEFGETLTQAAVERTRERLGRLARLSLVPRDDRG